MGGNRQKNRWSLFRFFGKFSLDFFYGLLSGRTKLLQSQSPLLWDDLAINNKPVDKDHYFPDHDKNRESATKVRLCQQ